MRKKLGLGAGFALTAAVIAIGGCGSKKTIINGSAGGELNNNGFPASSIAANNLASDGGGFSENNQTASFDLFTCKFNYKHPESDSASSADNSGMFFFVTKDNGSTGSNGREHVFVSYWNGSTFTPPVEITGEDRDESIPAGDDKGCHPAAVIMIPLNTSAFVNNVGTANARARANAGNWLVVWDGQTFTQNQLLTGLPGTGSTTPGIVTGSAIGPHHALWTTVFVKNLASQALATTNLIGNTAASGTANGPTIETHYGFQFNGAQLSPYRNGLGNGGSAFGNGAGAGFSNGTNLIKPAEDIVCAAAATDTFVHCATFSSSASDGDISGLSQGGNIGNVNGNFRLGPTSGNVTFVVSPGPIPPASTRTVNGVTIGSAGYEVGDSTSFIQLFWIQLVTSGTGLTRTTLTLPTTLTPGTVHLGPQYQLLTANWNLATMTVGGAATPFSAADSATATAVNPPVTRNTFTDGRRAQAQPFGTLVTYNNLLFWNYQDTSLQSAIGSTTGQFEGTIDNTGSTVLSTVAVIPGANGDATVANAQDVTLLGTSARHQVTNNSAFGTSSPIVVGEEFVSPFTCNGCTIIGPDEGQVDIVAFVLGNVTTDTPRGGGSLADIDTQLWAVAFQSTGANAGLLQAFTNNPKRISAHTADLPFPTTTANYTGFHDDVNDVKLNSSRDGTYDILAWRQAQGTSLNAQLALMSTVYKVFRSVAAGNSATLTTTPPTLDQRFPTTNPIQVNASPTAYTTGQQTGFGTGYTNGFDRTPVAAYQFQDHVSYKCGFQGDRTKTAILWIYSDGTEDRLFIKTLTVATGTAVTDAPTIAASGEVEIDSGTSVAAEGIELNPTGTRAILANFRFIPGTFGENIPTWRIFPGSLASGGVTGANCSSLKSESDTGFGFDRLESVDAGVNAAGAGGDVLVVFSKVVSATNNNYDRQIIAVLYNQTTQADRVVLSKTGIESTGQSVGNASVSFPNGNGLGAPRTYTGNVTGFNTVLWGLLPNSSKSSISTAAYSPDNGSYVYFGGPASNNNSSSRALYTRHYRARKATGSGTAVTFANTFFPAASQTTGDAAFKQPIRLDNADGNSDANLPMNPFHKARQAVVIFTQDNHIWGTVTADGESYTTKGGLPVGFLADNNISANQQTSGNKVKISEVCRLIDSNCDDLAKSPLFFIKNDVNLNDRLYVRVMQ